MGISGACGNDPVPEKPDAEPIDDAGPPPSFAQDGTAAYLHLQYVNLPPPFDMLGNGPLAGIGPFVPTADAPPPSFAEQPSPFGCKVFELTADQANDPGINVGAFEFTPNGSDWVTPPCVIVPGVGWACPGGMGTGGDIRVVNAEMGVFSISDPDAGFTGEQEIGRYLSINGAATGPNNGFFFVVGAADEDTLLFFNPGPGAEELDTSGQYVTIAGFGPAGRNDPIPDNAVLDVTLNAATEGPSLYEDFTVTGLPFGASFELDDNGQETISNIPLDGSAFEVGCDGDGGRCGPAMASVLILETTDAPIEGLPPFLLPPPQEKRVRIFCLNIIAGQSRVPAEASAFLVDSGATRIRTVFARVVPTDVFQDDTHATVLAGHAQAGFTDP